MMEKPDVDTIEGLSPAISIEQKSTSHNPRSTVGTITEIYDYLRLLYARAGIPRCPEHDVPLEAQTVSQMVDQVLALPEGSKLMLLAPVVRERKGEHLALLRGAARPGLCARAGQRQGTRAGRTAQTGQAEEAQHRCRWWIASRYAVICSSAWPNPSKPRSKLADGIALVHPWKGEAEEIIFSARFACPVCGHSISELEPKLFSFNNPAGACPTCDGLGVKQFFDARA
jgi:excinuclease ABC subunit A